MPKSFLPFWLFQAEERLQVYVCDPFTQYALPLFKFFPTSFFNPTPLKTLYSTFPPFSQQSVHQPYPKQQAPLTVTLKISIPSNQRQPFKF